MWSHILMPGVSCPLLIRSLETHARSEERMKQWLNISVLICPHAQTWKCSVLVWCDMFGAPTIKVPQSLYLSCLYAFNKCVWDSFINNVCGWHNNVSFTFTGWLKKPTLVYPFTKYSSNYINCQYIEKAILLNMYWSKDNDKTQNLIVKGGFNYCLEAHICR